MPLSSDNYYNYNPSILGLKRIPNIAEGLVERLNIHFAQLLYEDEFNIDPQKALNRVFISDVNAGSNIALGDVIQTFNRMTDLFPFTIYNIVEPLPRIEMNGPPKFGFTFIPEINSKVRAYPSELNIQYVTFYNNPIDYHASYTLLGAENSTLSRLYAPMFFNTVPVQIPFDLIYEINKGDLAYEFEQYLIQNRIWNINHNVKLNYFEYLLDEISIGTVEQILVGLGIITPTDLHIINEVVEVPDTPIIISTNPSNNALNISKNTEIQFNFSSGMLEETVIGSILRDPLFDYDYYWNNTSSQLNIIPIEPLLGDTMYTITIKKTAQSCERIPLENDYILQFVTEP